MYKQVSLLPGKEANVAFRHPWIFSGALAKIPDDLEHGDLVCVLDKNSKVLGTGTYSGRSSIAVRVLEFGETEITKDWFIGRLKAAAHRRELIGYGPRLRSDGATDGQAQSQTTGYRVLFGESDEVPGLVVDRFDNVIVFQIATAGMDRLREEIIEAIESVFAPSAIVERSDQPVRREEGLPEVVKTHRGEVVREIAYLEHGMHGIADVTGGQKTGAFFDQKDLRKYLVKSPGLCKGRNVLNLFSYTGMTGLAAIKGGAKHVLNVDSSQDALDLGVKIAKANDVSEKAAASEKEDVFQWLSNHPDVSYDMVVLDPPALIKANRDVEEGKKAYHFLNRAAMRIVKDGGTLITSSCSHFLTEDDLAFLLRRASVQAGVNLSILKIIRQSPDHPQSVYFPESAYLKTFICQVTRGS